MTVAPFLRRTLAACVLVTLAGLSACTGVSPGAGVTDVLTDSDESPERKRARIRLELALGYLEQGKDTIALDEVKLALAADPVYADAYNLRGLIYMRLNEWVLAQDSFGRALSLRPKDGNILHNFAWLRCQQALYPQAMDLFAQALANPAYGERAKTYLAQGLCQIRAGQWGDAEASLLKSYEFDPANPVTAYHLANVLFKRADYVRSQFYIRRLNDSELANAESLWLGIKVEKRLNNPQVLRQLAIQLEKRFPQSKEAASYHRGAFDE